MIKPIPENILIDGFKRGEEKALSHFYKLHFRPLCYFAERLTGNKQEGEDIVAETFSRLWKIRENFDSSTNIKAFLYISVRNACLNYIKFMKRQAALQKEMLYLADDSEDEGSFLYEVEANVLHHVYAEIENLPVRCRQIFKMIFFEGLSTAEIAERMGISPNTVLNQKARAYRLLRVVLLKRKLLEVFMYWTVLVFYWYMVKFHKFLYQHFNLFLM